MSPLTFLFIHVFVLKLRHLVSLVSHRHNQFGRILMGCWCDGDNDLSILYHTLRKKMV